jgi:ABC-type glycerol-3-phosphate transport system permease component
MQKLLGGANPPMHKNQPFYSISHYAVILFLLLITVFPFYMTLLNSFKDRVGIIKQFWGIPTALHWENYATASRYLWPFLIHSAIITASIVAGVLLLSSMAAYSFSRFQFPGKELLYILIVMLFMIPGFLLLVPQFVLIKNMGLLNTYTGQVLPPMTVGATMATMLMREFFSNIPRGFFEAAEMEGAPERTIFLRIAIPLSLPVIAVVAILNTMSGWNNFIWPLVITSGDAVKPVVLALGRIPGTVQQGMSLQLAGYVIASIPLIALFAFANRAFVAGVTSGSIKG